MPTVKISETKKVESALDYAEAIVKTVRDPLVILDHKLHIVSANSSFYKFFHAKKQSIQGMLFYEVGNGQWNKPNLKKLLEDTLTKKISFDNFKVEGNFSVIGWHTFQLHARRLQQKKHKNPLILLTLEDVSEAIIVDKQKDNFIKITSQKINEPTVNIKNYGHSLKKSPVVQKDKKTSHIVSKLNFQSKELTGIVNKFIDTSTFFSDSEFPSFSKRNDPVKH